jgi:DNA-directed RNA polymerase subunit RPC12/RpoP
LIALIKDDVYRWIGAILIGLGLFFDMVGILGATVINEEMEAPPESYWGIVGLCTVVFVLPGIAIFAWGWKLGQKQRELEKLAGFLKSYRRVSISDVAHKLDRSEYDTEHLITECVEKGLIRGYFDRSSGEFFTYESMFEEVKRPDKCPNCGASMYTRVLSGESAVCNYCGARFTPPPMSTPNPLPPSPPPYYSQQPPYPSRPPPSSYPSSPERQNIQAPPRPSKKVAQMMNVRCPSCRKVFDVEKMAAPSKISCPFCGTEGMIG